MQDEKIVKVLLNVTKEQFYVLINALDLYNYADSFINYAEHAEEYQSLKCQLMKKFDIESGCNNVC